jgi:gluconolactonase
MAGSVEIRDSRFASVVGKPVAVEKLATGFLFTEGPLWHAGDRYLLFSDMPGDHLRRWSADMAETPRFASPAVSRTALRGTARAG